MAYIGVFVLAAALIVGFIAWRANELLTTKVMETLNAEVQGLREQFQAGGPARLRDIITERSSEPGSSLYLLVDAGDRKIAGNLSRVPPELREGGRGSIFRYVRASEAAARTERLAVGVSFAVPGGFILIVGRDIEDQRRFADTMWLVALWSVGLMSVLGIGAGLLVSRSVLRRIETVTEASRTIMAGDLSKRIPLDGSGDELDRLSQNLNAMLTRIEELMGALREVSDNIAHDLKTPLNRLRNRAEAALRDPDGPAGYRDGLVKTIEEADELIKTFNSLLLIARLEGGAVAESMAPVDPASIIEDVAELYEPVAEQMGLRLEIATSKGLSVVANRELVGQAIANLVDNAIKYAAADRAPADGAAPQTDHHLVAPVGDAVEIHDCRSGPGRRTQGSRAGAAALRAAGEKPLAPRQRARLEPRRRRRAAARRLDPARGQRPGPQGRAHPAGRWAARLRGGWNCLPLEARRRGTVGWVMRCA